MIRTAFAVIAAVLIAAAFHFMQAPGEPGVFMRDFEAYWSAGRAALAHADPYSLALQRYEFEVPGVTKTGTEFLPFVGAPPMLPVWMVFARVPYSVAAQAWVVVLALALVTLIYCSVRIASPKVTIASGVLAGLCALAFVPITSDFELGQPALLAYTAAALAVLASSRSWAGVAFSTIVGAVQPNVALPAVVVAGRVRGLIGLAVAAMVLYLGGAFVAGAQWPMHYFALLQTHGAAERYDAIQYTPASIAFGFGAPPQSAHTIGVIVAILALCLAVVAVIRAATTTHRFVIASAAVPLITTFTHEHDLVLLFAPALWALRHTSKSLRPAALFGFGIVAVNWMDFAQQPQAVMQDLTLSAAAVIAGLAWCENRTAALYVAGCAAFGCAIFGAWLGAHHPAPIWPNDMQAFTMPANPSAANLWHSEQFATGLEKVEPAWALLRSFALVGSVSILIAVSYPLVILNLSKDDKVEWL